MLVLKMATTGDSLKVSAIWCPRGLHSRSSTRPPAASPEFSSTLLRSTRGTAIAGTFLSSADSNNHDEFKITWFGVIKI